MQSTSLSFFGLQYYLCNLFWYKCCQTGGTAIPQHHHQHRQHRILVHKIKFSMDDIRTVVHGLHEMVRKRLNELLFVDREDAMPALDLKTLCNNAAELSEG